MSSTLSKERVDGLLKFLTRLSDEQLERNRPECTGAELMALLAAYRTREAAIAECEAWRRCSTWERSMKGFTQEDAENLERAIAATDAARRGEGQ